MATQYPEIGDAHRKFIARQHVFFTATAAEGTRINLSPRSTDLLRVIDAGTVAYLDRTGSGNETATHIRADGRLTFMLCAFEGPPMIMRLYGRGRVLSHGSAEYAEMLSAWFEGTEPRGARQIIVLDVDLVQTSCGFGVPFHDYKGERNSMDRWTDSKSDAELVEFRNTYNTKSLDGLPTGHVEKEAGAS